MNYPLRKQLKYWMVKMPEPEQRITEDMDPMFMRDGVEVRAAVPLPPIPLGIHPDAQNWTPSVPTPPPVPHNMPIDPTPGTSFEEATGSINYMPLDMTGAEVGIGDPVHGDNVEAAMNDLAEGMDLTISTRVSDDDGPADKQVLIRATERDRERWKRAAEKVGVSLSALVRDVMNKQATDVLDCSHPPQYRKDYPWASFCTKCDMRLNG